MARVGRFEELEVWKRSRLLTRRVYACTRRSEFARDFGLKDQIRRAAVSTMSNIAEGFERGGTQEFIHFLSTSKASSGEVRSQLYVAFDQNYITAEEFDEMQREAEAISRMIASLMEYLKQSEIRGSKYNKQKNNYRT